MSFLGSARKDLEPKALGPNSSFPLNHATIFFSTKAVDVKSIKSAVANQTKDTKDGLDPIREGKGSSSSLFSPSTKSLLSDSYWFRIFPVRGKNINQIKNEKEIFLGEFVKSILKINNIAKEFEKICELLQNLPLLQKIKEIPQLTLKYVATNQSLYI